MARFVGHAAKRAGVRRKAKCNLVAAVLASVIGANCMAATQAAGDDVDRLLAEMDEASRHASALNEEVKGLEEKAEAKQHDMDAAKERAHTAKVRADEALAAENDYRSEINKLAASKYRGTVKNPAVATLGARNPQNALDRAAYLSTLAREAESVAEELSRATELAAGEHDEATRAAAAAEFQRNELNHTLDELRAESEELTKRTEDIVRQVEALDAESRARWETKNGPLEANLAGVVGSEAGMAAVSAAMSKLGSPYGWGSAGPTAFDCSGLMVWAFQQQGKAIPRTSQAQMAGGTPVSRADLQPGDIVGYYPGATHVGMYIGNGQLVHASDYGIPVQVVSVDSMPWYGAVRY